jgi:hypothetical protein
MKTAFVVDGGSQLDLLIFHLKEAQARRAGVVLLYTSDEDKVNDELSNASEAMAVDVEYMPESPDLLFFGTITVLGFEGAVDDFRGALEVDERLN